MISRNIFTDILVIVVLIVLQIFLLNEISIIDKKYSPVFYTVFVIFFPFHRNKYHFLLMSFLLGIGIDAFSGTWGINAFSTTLIAYFRTLIFRASTESSTDFFSFQSLSWSQFLLFVFFSVFLHQLSAQFIEYFRLSQILEFMMDVFFTSVFSFVFILFYILIFKIKEKV